MPIKRKMSEEPKEHKKSEPEELKEPQPKTEPEEPKQPQPSNGSDDESLMPEGGGPEIFPTKKELAETKRKQQRLFSATVKGKGASADQLAVAKAYEAEGKAGSAVKDALLANFMADKSCKWCHEVLESRFEVVTRKDASFHGHASKFQIAKALNLDAKDPEQAMVLESVLSELPVEGEWDPNVPMERGYAKSGVKRYRFDMTALSELNKADVKRCGVTSTKAIDREREKFMERETNKPEDIDL